MKAKACKFILAPPERGCPNYSFLKYIEMHELCYRDWLCQSNISVQAGEIADFMIRAMQLNDHETRKLETIFQASGIEYRHSVIEDYGRQKEFTFYPNTADFEPFPSTSKRLQYFRDHALDLSVRAVENLFSKVP